MKFITLVPIFTLKVFCVWNTKGSWGPSIYTEGPLECLYNQFPPEDMNWEKNRECTALRRASPSHGGRSTQLSSELDHVLPGSTLFPEGQTQGEAPALGIGLRSQSYVTQDKLCVQAVLCFHNLWREDNKSHHRYKKVEQIKWGIGLDTMFCQINALKHLAIFSSINSRRIGLTVFILSLSQFSY